MVDPNLNPATTAPEVLESKDISPKSDVYSFSMILFETITGDTPYDPEINPEWKFRQKIEEAVRKGVKPPYSKEKIDKYLQIDMPREMIAALESAWDVQPGRWKRPSFNLLTSTFCTLLSTFWPAALQMIPKSNTSNWSSCIPYRSSDR